MAEAGAANPTRGILLFMSALMMFGLMDTLVKHVTQTHPVFVVVWGRYLAHFLFAIPLVYFARRTVTIRTRRPFLQLARSLALFAATALFFTAISVLPLATATSVMFSAPLFVAAMSAVFLGEKVGWRRWTAVIVGFGGVLVIVRPGTGFDNWYLLLPLAAGAIFASFQIATRLLSFADDALTTFLYTGFMGTVAASIIVPFEWELPTTEGWILMTLAGLFGSLGHYILIRAYAHTEASLLAPFTYVQLVWATILGLLVFGDFPDEWTIAGALILVASGLYIWWRERHLHAKT